MIKPIGFTGLHVNYDKNKPLLDRLLISNPAFDAAIDSFKKIGETAGSKDVYLKASKCTNEELGLDKHYDSSGYIKLQILDKEDGGDKNVMAEVITCADEPFGTHSYCIARKFNQLAGRFRIGKYMPNQR